MESVNTIWIKMEVAEEVPDAAIPEDPLAISEFEASIAKEPEKQLGEDTPVSDGSRIAAMEDANTIWIKMEDPDEAPIEPEAKYEVESPINGSEGQRSPVESEYSSDGSGTATTRDGQNAGTDGSVRYTAEREASCGNESGTRRPLFGCKKTFGQLRDLEKCRNVDCGDLSLSCSVCHKVFTRRDSLKLHIRLHTGERPYICDVCSTAFTHISNLKRHLLLHTGHRPYSCGVCNKTFTHSNSLKKHSLLHTGERPYRCGVCHKAFTSSSSCKEHSRIHTGERPYSCAFCQMAFTNSSNLRRHSVVHAESVTCAVRGLGAGATRVHVESDIQDESLT